MKIGVKGILTSVSIALLIGIIFMKPSGWLLFTSVCIIIITLNMYWRDFKKTMNDTKEIEEENIEQQGKEEDALESNYDYIMETFREYMKDEMYEDAAELLQNTKAIPSAGKVDLANDILVNAADSMPVNDYLDFFEELTGSPFSKAKSASLEELARDLADRIEDAEEAEDIEAGHSSKLAKLIIKNYRELATE